jgi:hypothetical protein
MRLYAGYEDAYDQFISNRASGWANSRVLEALSQASEDIYAAFSEIFNLSDILSPSTWELDFTASMPANSETLDIRGQTYVFVTATPAASGEIKIQGNATDMAAVVEAAVNGEYHADVYSTTPMDPYCTGVAASGVLTLASRKVGSATAKYAITDWDSSRVSVATEGTGKIPLFQGWALDLFGGYLFAGGAQEAQGRTKAASERAGNAWEAMKPYLEQERKLYYYDSDDERRQVPLVTGTAGYSTYNAEKGYAERMKDKDDEFYEELYYRKHGDL